jgi:hypothetical protein
MAGGSRPSIGGLPRATADPVAIQCRKMLSNSAERLDGAMTASLYAPTRHLRMHLRAIQIKAELETRIQSRILYNSHVVNRHFAEFTAWKFSYGKNLADKT